MGNLLKLLQNEDNCNWPKCVNSARFPDVFIDFANAKPNSENAEEISVYNESESILVKSTTILQKIKDYEGARMFSKVSRSICFS